MYTSAGVYRAGLWPIDTILLYICREHGKIIEEILPQLDEKEA